MNTNSNSYTIIYASVLVIIVAFLLAFVLMNIFAPLINYVVVQNNISRRAKRAMSNN